MIRLVVAIEPHHRLYQCWCLVLRRKLSSLLDWGDGVGGGGGGGVLMPLGQGWGLAEEKGVNKVIGVEQCVCVLSL